MWWRSRLNTKATIFALASGSVPSAVAIIRLSGEDSLRIATELCQIDLNRLKDRQASLLSCYSGSMDILDQSLVIPFFAPHSFTGQNVVEIQCHGSEVVVQGIQQRLVELGAELAQPGEFSLRAWSEGKMSHQDLENLVSLFQARDIDHIHQIYQRKDSVTQGFVDRLKSDLLNLQAILETSIDFSDEYEHVYREAEKSIEMCLHSMKHALDLFDHYQQETKPYSIALIGQPNAGKSSLFNALVKQERAIVHQQKGTTRDVIHQDIYLQGKRVRLFDTAGMRDSEDQIELIGIHRTREQMEAADLVLYVVDSHKGLSREDEKILEELSNQEVVVLFNKSDVSRETSRFLQNINESEFLLIPVSAISGEGLKDLYLELKNRMAASREVFHDVPLLSSRHQSGFQKTYQSMLRLKGMASKQVTAEVLSEELRQLISYLEGVIGQFDEETFLDKVFSSFCIGK